MPAPLDPKHLPAFDDPNANHEVFFQLAELADAELYRAHVQQILDAAQEATGQRASTVTVFPHAQRFLVVGKAKLLQWLIARPDLRAQMPPKESAMIKPVRKRPARLKSAGR